MKRLDVALFAGFALAALVAPHFLKSYGVYLLTLWVVYIMAAQGLNLTMGYAGQISLGQAGFFGIGAYTVAVLMAGKIPGFETQLSFWIALPLGTLLCFGVGLLLGFPALRVQHHYLAFATLGFNALVFLAIRNEEWLTGGNFGLRITRPELFGFSLNGSIAFYYLCLVALAGASLVLWWILRSPWGRAFNALRDNPIRAESLGVNVRNYTLFAFAIGAAFGGFAGGWFAVLVNFIEPGPFAVGASMSMLLMVIVGGSGRFFGPFLGAGLVTLLPEWLRFMQSWYLVAFGIFVVLLMVWCPGGLLALPEKIHLKKASA
jgi:branched-chain amino acid transport system permease protein